MGKFLENFLEVKKFLRKFELLLYIRSTRVTFVMKSTRVTSAHEKYPVMSYFDTSEVTRLLFVIRRTWTTSCVWKVNELLMSSEVHILLLIVRNLWDTFCVRKYWVTSVYQKYMTYFCTSEVHNMEMCVYFCWVLSLQSNSVTSVYQK